MHHARSTLMKIFTDTLRREGGDDAPLLAWPLACGATTADKTRAVSYAEGVLTVAVPDASWRRQLQSLSGQYLAALNRISTHPVSRIHFVAGSHLQDTSR